MLDPDPDKMNADPQPCSAVTHPPGSFMVFSHSDEYTSLFRLYRYHFWYGTFVFKNVELKPQVNNNDLVC
jgi:hypothetical protein